MRKLVPVLSMPVAIVFALLGIAAQAPQGGQGQGRGQAAAAPPRPQGVDAATAKKTVAAAEAAAIAVVDGNGDLVFFEPMDGASVRAVTSSQTK